MRANWSMAEFLNHVELRGQAWCIVEIGERGGISVSPSQIVFFYAVRAGYRSEAAFIRRFTEQLAVTPGRMRANHQRGTDLPSATS